LDVGCAYGYCVEAAQNHFEACGIDVSPHAIEAARQRGLDCCVSTLTNFHSPERFDVITMLDCIEHLPEPQRDIGAAFELLRPSGILVITTGDIDTLTARLAGKRWRLMTPPQHLHFFSKQSLTRLVETAGFKPLVARRDWKRVPLALAAYQLCRRLGAPAGWTGNIRGALPVNLFDTITLVAERPA
jgi:SAM-dependent methyltransferase